MAKCQVESEASYHKEWERHDSDPNFSGEKVGDGILPGDVSNLVNKRSEEYYDQCLRRNGLEK